MVSLYSAGAIYVPAGPKEFVTGDKVKCDLDMEVLSIASAVGEGADEHISMVGYSNNYNVHVRTVSVINVISEFSPGII